MFTSSSTKRTVCSRIEGGLRALPRANAVPALRRAGTRRQPGFGRGSARDRCRWEDWRSEVPSAADRVPEAAAAARRRLLERRARQASAPSTGRLGRQGPRVPPALPTAAALSGPAASIRCWSRRCHAPSRPANAARPRSAARLAGTAVPQPRSALAVKVGPALGGTQSLERAAQHLDLGQQVRASRPGRARAPHSLERALRRSTACRTPTHSPMLGSRKRFDHVGPVHLAEQRAARRASRPARTWMRSAATMSSG